MAEHPHRPLSCPACATASPVRLDSVGCAAIIDAYRQSFGIDVAASFADAGAALHLLRCSRCDLRWFDPPVTGDDRLYESLQAKPWYYQDGKPEYGFAQRWIASSATVLEVGCGRGAFARELPASVRYKGLEFNDLAVRQARQAGLDVTRRRIEDEAAEHAGAWGVVCHFQVLEHVPDVRGFMQSCMRALAPGGTLIVAVPSEDSFLSLVTGGWLNMPPHHLTRWTDRALASLAADLGLQQVEIVHEPVAPFHAAWYREVLRQAALAAWTGRPPGLAARPGLARLSRLAARVPGLAATLARRAERGFGFAQHGHTVLMKGVKPPAGTATPTA